MLSIVEADLSPTTKNALTPLHFAAVSGHVAVIEALYNGGADVTAITEARETPLHAAAILNVAIINALK